MQLNSIKTTLSAIWILSVALVGMAATVQSLSGWAILAGLAILPPLVMMLRWNAPRPTMSETIQEQLR